MHKSFSVLFVFAAACATPAYKAPDVPVPATYNVGIAAQPIAELPARRVTLTSLVTNDPFWNGFGDTTLARLIAEAQHANTDVRVAESRLLTVRAQRRLVSLDQVPTVTGVGSTSRVRQSLAQTPGLTHQLPSEQLWDVGFDASWELDFFGRVNRKVRAQSALVESSAHDLDDVRVTIASEVARTYFELRGAERQLAVAERNAANQRGTVKLAEDRLAAGRGTAFDTERAKAVLYLTLASTPLLETQVELGHNRLAVLLGETPDSFALPPAASRNPPLLPDTLNLGSPNDIIRRRPDVLRAERLLAARTLFVGAARADYLPRFTLGARAGYLSTSADSLFRGGNSRLLVGPAVTVPLFDFGRVKQRVDIAQAGRQEASAEYDATVLRALEESQGSIVAYDRARLRLAILTAAVQSSARAAALARQRFDAGLTDFLQVLDAERTQLAAENQLVGAQTAAQTALVAVYKAAGGTWPSAEH